MIHNLELFGAITLALLPFLLVVAIVIAAGWMLIEWIPIWYKRWKELDDDNWWKK